MKNKLTEPKPLWIEISHLDEPRSRWIWLILDGEPDASREGGQSFHALRVLQENLEACGYQVPRSAEIDQVVIRAREEGLTDAILKVLPKNAP